MDVAREWISGLGPELAVQARLAEALLAAVEVDARWEWLELGCSVAEGRGDSLSDLDVGLGHVGEQPPPTGEVSDMLCGLGAVVDLSAGLWNGVPRWWVQYEDGGQIDLVALPATSRIGRAPGSVALLDRTGRLGDTFTPQALHASAGDRRGWLLDGWEALSNVAKYLQRGSILEAVEQIHRARTDVFRLWATGEGVDYPVFGLTSLLDAAEAGLPDGIETTYPSADDSAVLVAALATATLLAAAGRHADPQLQSPMQEFVAKRLEGLSDNTRNS